MRVTDGSGFTRAAAAVFALLAAVTWLAAGFAAGMTCDDTCETGAADWHQDPDAPQWTELGALAWTTLALAAAAIVLVRLGRRREALLAVVIHAAVSLRLGMLLDPGVLLPSFAGLAMVLSVRVP